MGTTEEFSPYISIHDDAATWQRLTHAATVRWKERPQSLARARELLETAKRAFRDLETVPPCVAAAGITADSERFWQELGDLIPAERSTVESLKWNWVQMSEVHMPNRQAPDIEIPFAPTAPPPRPSSSDAWLACLAVVGRWFRPPPISDKQAAGKLFLHLHDLIDQVEVLFGAWAIRFADETEADREPPSPPEDDIEEARRRS
jgi:hypothetical protein